MGKKGQGCVYKQNGCFYFQMRVNRVRKLIALKASNADEAGKEAEKYRRLWASQSIEELGHLISAAKGMIQKSGLELKDVWTRYLESPSRPDSGAGTLGNYETQWKAFLKWLAETQPGAASLDQITADIAQAYAIELWDVKKLAPSTYNQHIKTLRLITRIVGRNALRANPWEEIQLKTELKQKRKDFSPGEIARILAWFDEGEGKIRDQGEMKTLFYVGAHTGLRLESAVNLKWDNVDLKHGRISCVPAKTARLQRAVSIPLPPPLRAVLEALPRRDGYLMPALNARYGKKSEGKVPADIMKVLTACGFDVRSRDEGEDKPKGRGINRRLYGFHSFRHAYASACANAGVPISTLAEILGDSIATLQKYYMHAQDEAKDKIFAALAPPEQEKPGQAKRAALIEKINEKLARASLKELGELLRQL